MKVKNKLLRIYRYYLIYLKGDLIIKNIRNIITIKINNNYPDYDYDDDQSDRYLSASTNVILN